MNAISLPLCFHAQKHTHTGTKYTVKITYFLQKKTWFNKRVKRKMYYMLDMKPPQTAYKCVCVCVHLCILAKM